MRPLLLLPLLALALPAAAQDVLPTTLDLTNDGAFDPDLDCAFAYDGAIAWFDGGTESVYVYNDEDETTPDVAELYTAAAIDAAVGVDAVACRAAAYDPAGDVVYFALATADNVDFIAAFRGFDEATPLIDTVTSPTTGAADGVTGLVVTNGRLYAAVSEFFNDPPEGGADDLDDGVYSFSLDGTEDQTPTPFAVFSDLSLTSLTATADGSRLYATSNRFGVDDFQNVIVEIDFIGSPPAVSVFDDPFDGEVFTVPSDERRFDLASLVAASDGNDEALFVLNNNFTGPAGEEIARFALDFTDEDNEGELFLTQTSILDDLGRTEPGFTPGAGPNALLYDAVEDRLYIVNSSAFSGADEVIVAAPGFATDAADDRPADVAAFEATPNPFSDRLAVAVTLDRAQDVGVAVYDVLGRRVADLYRGSVAAGQRLALTLDAGALPSGVYLVRLQTEAGAATRAVTLAR